MESLKKWNKRSEKIWLVISIISTISAIYFSFVDDKGDLHKNIEMNNEEIDKNFDCHCGCGIFEMTKL